MFTGEYRHTVDDKGRIAVPVKFRAQLDPGSMISGWLDDCLAIHPKAVWDDLAAKVAALPLTDQRSRLFQRFVFSQAIEAEMDKQGRVLLPAYLRSSMGRGGAALVVGWRAPPGVRAPGRGGAHPPAHDAPQELARAFEGLGI